jgi:putative flippase GtrA
MKVPQYRPMIKTFANQFSKFAAVGAVGTLFHYLLLIALVSGFSVLPVLATSCGAVLGALVNYWLNRVFTFQSERQHREALPRYLLMASVGLGLNALLLGALVSQGMHYLVAQLLATGFILMTNYIVSRKWIFPQPND